MAIRKLEILDLPYAKRLWKQAFSDTDNYIDFNFENNLSLNNSVAIFEDEKLVCMLFMMPKTIVINNKKIKIQFIAGVSTDNEYRYKGYAKRLMEYTHDMLKEQGYPFVFLYPFNHDFYRKLGYETVNMMNKLTFECGDGQAFGYSLDSYDSLAEKIENRVLDIYERSYKLYDSYYERNKDDFSKIMSTLFVDGGKVDIIRRGNDDVGYVFYYIEKNKIHCSESLFLDCDAAEAYTKLVSNSGFIYCNEDFKVNNSKLEEYAMINIFDKRYDFILKNKVLILEQY